MNHHISSSYDETQGRELDLPNYEEAENDPRARFSGCAVFIDVENSTGMKLVSAPKVWAATIFHFYKLAETQAFAPGEPMPHVKFGGDSVLATFHDSDTTRAINFAIDIQEALRRANTPQQGQETGEVQYNVSIGIAVGMVYRFRMRDGGIDHVGPAVDLAARLCGVANPKAILVERNAIYGAKMLEVRSPQGEMDQRQISEYAGEVQEIHVKGRPAATQYHEILWSSQLFGVKSSAATTATKLAEVSRSEQPAAPARVQAPPVERSKPVIGEVTRWKPEEGFGFVRNRTTGEDFHFTRESLCFVDDAPGITVGSRMAFMEGPDVASPVGKRLRRNALQVLLVGKEAEGRVTKTVHDRGFGFIAVRNDRGGEIGIFMPITEKNEWVKVGMEVGFDVGEGPRGPRAENVERLDDEGATTTAA